MEREGLGMTRSGEDYRENDPAMEAAGKPRLEPEDALCWFVAHTRPRCEKKLVQECTRGSVEATLPCYQNVRKYQGKTKVFDKPIFPGYVFLFMPPQRRQFVAQSQNVATLLTVPDQTVFERQLQDVLTALEAKVPIQLAPEIGLGKSVRIKRGPLAGMQGWVESRYGMCTVLLRLDFIGQAAAIQMHADDLEPN